MAQVTLVLGLAQLFLVEILFRVIMIYWFTQFQKMKQASMTFSVAFEFFNLENPNVNFLWKTVVLDKPPIFHTKSNEIPMIWPQIRVPRCRKPFGQPFMENSWFLLKPLVFHGTIPDTNDLTLDSSSSMSKTLRSTLMENSWFLSKSMFFWSSADIQATKQASKQFMFVRLFSTRKRINNFNLNTFKMDWLTRQLKN